MTTDEIVKLMIKFVDDAKRHLRLTLAEMGQQAGEIEVVDVAGTSPVYREMIGADLVCVVRAPKNGDFPGFQNSFPCGALPEGLTADRAVAVWNAYQDKLQQEAASA